MKKLVVMIGLVVGLLGSVMVSNAAESSNDIYDRIEKNSETMTEKELQDSLNHYLEICVEEEKVYGTDDFSYVSAKVYKTFGKYYEVVTVKVYGDSYRIVGEIGEELSLGYAPTSYKIYKGWHEISAAVFEVLTGLYVTE